VFASVVMPGGNSRNPIKRLARTPIKTRAFIG
jgi:hypothetical protein